LLTAYSQIKLNKSIDEYQDKISNVKKEKINYETGLNSSLSENKMLLEELEQKEEDLKLQKDKVHLLDSQLQKENKDIEMALNQYEYIIMANDEYVKGDTVGCALTLNSITKKEGLGSEGIKKYNFLYEKTNVKAAMILYNQGYEEYRKGNYKAAINTLQSSLSLTRKEYFSDDGLFFLAYSQYRLGNKAAAKIAFSQLISEYPQSTYKTECDKILSQLK